MEAEKVSLVTSNGKAEEHRFYGKVIGEEPTKEERVRDEATTKKKSPNQLHIIYYRKAHYYTNVQRRRKIADFQEKQT